MAVLNFTSAESGAITEYPTLGGTINISSAQAINGTYSVRVNPTGTNVGYIEPNSPSGVGAGDNATIYNLVSIYITFWFRVETLPASGSEFILLAQNTSNVYKGGIQINSSGNLLAMDSTSASVAIATGLTVLSINTWYRIDYLSPTGTSATYEIKINEVSELSGTGNFTASNNRRLRLGKAQNTSGQSVVFFYDKIITDNSAFADTNIDMAFDVPSGDGTYTAWTAGTNASNYLEVDDRPFDFNTTIVLSTTNGDRQSVTFPSTSTAGITGTVLAVKINNWSTEATAGTSELVAFTKSGVTVTDGTAQDIITNYNVYRVVYSTTDPNTGIAWTLSGVDGLEGGVMEGATSGVRVRTSAIYRQVLFISEAVGSALVSRLPLLGVG